jgi:DNA-binding NarL/FixJ family response regulator
MNISILDDHRIIVELLKFLLVNYEFITSITPFESGEKFLAHLNIRKTDLLILDMRMSDMSGIDIISQCRIRKAKSELKILVLSGTADANLIKEALRCGANGIISKKSSIDELINAIKFIQSETDKTYISIDLKDILIQSQLLEPIIFNLSVREKELLESICFGKTPKEISFELGLSISTIQSYMKSLMRKMKVNRTVDLVIKAIEYGLVYPKWIA